jgi:hypothetical protein
MHHGVRARRSGQTHRSSLAPLPAGFVPGLERGDSRLGREPAGRSLDALAAGEILSAVAARGAIAWSGYGSFNPAAAGDLEHAVSAARHHHAFDARAEAEAGIRSSLKP